MRMDRSKQGVAPRTCLSKLPLKPRPNGPPGGVGSNRPQSPGMRNFSGPPSTGPRNAMYPAPLSPSMPNMNVSGPMAGSQDGRQRSQSIDMRPRQSPQMMQSPGFGASPPRDHRRSASVSQLAGQGSPQSALPVRKPVPGQAM